MPSKSAKQAKFMRAVAHSPKFAKKVGVSQKVGKEFEMADKKKRKFADGGSSKYDERYKRKIADIEKDFAKASKGKTGKAADVAKAKYEQRMADAKDDLAKWTKSDRTQTRAAEKSAERNLSMTRKFGAMKSATEKDVGTTARVGPVENVIKSVPKPQAPASGKFGDAFRAARAAGDKTFTWQGKSYTTKMAGESSAKAAPKAGAGAPPKAGAGTSNKGAQLPASFQKKTGTINMLGASAPKGDMSKLMDTPAMAKARATMANKPAIAAKTATPVMTAAERAAAERERRAKLTAQRRKESAAVKTNMAKGGTVKKPMPKEGATGSSSTVPMTPERKAFLKRMQAEEAASKKGVKPNPSKYAKGGKMADKAGRALKKKSADTMGRAMMKKAGGGKCYAKGGSVSSRADGIAKKGKTKGKIC